MEIDFLVFSEKWNKYEFFGTACNKPHCLGPKKENFKIFLRKFQTSFFENNIKEYWATVKLLGEEILLKIILMNENMVQFFAVSEIGADGLADKFIHCLLLFFCF